MATQPANDPGVPLDSLELEEALLGLLLTDNAHVDRVADVVCPDDFSEPAYRAVFQGVVELVSQGRPANPATLRVMFEDPAFLIQLTANPSTYFTSATAAKELASIGARRRMREGLLNAAREAADLTVADKDIVELADAAIAPKARGQMRQESVGNTLSTYVGSLDRETQGVICQHIPSLDNLHGPLEPSQLVILAARPGMGKTAAALSYASGVAQAGHGVLFVSLEMNSEQLGGRFLADLCFDGSQIPYSAIRDRKVNDFQRRKLAEAASRAGSLPLDIIDAGTLSPGRLGMVARRFDRRLRARGSSLDLIVVDYLQLMRPDSGTNKPYEAVSEISRALKALAKDQGVAILALAQLSREVEKRPDRRPQLSDLRDSGQIEQDADSVIFLLREEYYLRLAEPEQMHPDRAKWEYAMDQAKGRIEFILAKRRNGTTGTAIGQFHGAYQAVRG